MNDVIRFFKQQTESGYFCGFYEVPQTVIERIENTWPRSVWKQEIIRVMEYSTDLTLKILEQVEYLEYLPEEPKARVHLFKANLAELFTLMDEILDSVRADNTTEKIENSEIEYKELAKAVKNFHIQLGQHTRKLNQARVIDELDERENLDDFFKELEKFMKAMPEMRMALKNLEGAQEPVNVLPPIQI
jgi:hypothetical protein